MSSWQRFSGYTPDFQRVKSSAGYLAQISIVSAVALNSTAVRVTMDCVSMYAAIGPLQADALHRVRLVNGGSVTIKLEDRIAIVLLR